MTKKILAFGASNSKKSINKILANYTANQIDNVEIDLIDLNKYEMPIYSIDRQNEIGVPQLANDFLDKVNQADGIIISFAEHNGSYSVAFKNIFDWASRVVKNVWMNKPMFIISSSPGPGGARFVLDTAVKKFTHMSSNIVVNISIPSFNDNFSNETGIVNKALSEEFKKQLQLFENSL